MRAGWNCWSIIIIIIGILFAPTAYASWDEYHEIEENSPAYIENGEQIEKDDRYWDQMVFYFDDYNQKRYCTRRYAVERGFSFFPVRNRYNRVRSERWNPGYSTVGKRFYPNSNYKREVTKKRQRGFLSTVLGILI